MFRHSLVAITILLVSFGSPVVLKAQQQHVGGHGVYRPLNLLRQLKLGTAYFVNPCLPGEAKIFNAYRLQDLPLQAAIVEQSNNPQEMPEQTESGQLWLAVQIPEQPPLALTIPCQSAESDSQGPSADDAPCTLWVFRDNAELQNWFDDVSKDESFENSLGQLYVLSSQEDVHLYTDVGKPVISWNPGELVDNTGLNMRWYQ